MNLGRLLAAGKSLIGARTAEGRYRMDKHASLPKFISPKNPFASPNQEAAEEPSATKAASGRSSAETAAARLKETQQLPAAATARSAGRRTSVVRIGAQVCATAGDWARTLNPLRFRARQTAPVKPGPARLIQGPVQGELSLDKVKVVRNDLTDADLEIVRRRPAATGVAGETGLQTAVHSDSSESPWNRFATRIFGEGAT